MITTVVPPITVVEKLVGAGYVDATEVVRRSDVVSVAVASLESIVMELAVGITTTVSDVDG